MVKNNWLPVLVIVFMMALAPFPILGKGMADKFLKLSYLDEGTGINDFDIILGGSTVTKDVKVIKNHFVCAQRLLEGGAQDTAGIVKRTYVKTVPVVPEGVEAVYVRHPVRTGDSSGNDSDPSNYSSFTYAGVWCADYSMRI